MNRLAVLALSAVALVSPSLAQSNVNDAVIVSFFNQEDRNWTKPFSTPAKAKDAAVLRAFFEGMLAEDAPSLSPKLKNAGIDISEKELAAAIEEARSLSATHSRLAQDAVSGGDKGAGPDMEKVSAQAAALSGPAGMVAAAPVQAKKEEPPLGSSPLFRNYEPWNPEFVFHVGGGKVQRGPGVGSVGVSVRAPLLSLGPVGHIGGEAGLIFTGYDHGYGELLSDTIVNQWEDYQGHPHETYRQVTAQHNDFVQVVDLLGVHYRTPEIAQRFSLEAGGRMGYGMNNRRTVVTETGYHQYITHEPHCHDDGHGGCTYEDRHVERTDLDYQKTLSDAGPRHSGVVFSAYAAANVAINESFGLRFEVARTAMDALKVKAMNTARVAVAWRF